MNALTNMPTPPADADASDAAAAFRTLNLKIAGLTAAVEGFAARQQEIQGRDYSADLARIYERLDKLKGAMLTLDDRPALKLTPETIATQITKASYTVRERDYEFLNAAIQQFTHTAQTLIDVTQSAKTAEHQKKSMIGALVLGFVLGFVCTATTLDLFDHIFLGSSQTAVKHPTTHPGRT